MNLHRYGLCFLLAAGLNVSMTLSAAEPRKTEKSEKPTAAEFTDPKLALAGIPRDVMQDLRAGSRKLDDAVAKATEQVRKNVVNKEATLKFTIGSVEKFKRPDAPEVTRYRVHAMTEKIRESGATFDVMLMAVPDVSEDAKIAKLAKGDKVVFTGKISSGEITARNGAILHIDILDAKLK